MQFTFFPYFPSRDADIKVGRVHLFNFWKYKDVYIKDDGIKVVLEKICEMYLKPNLERANNLTVCVLDNDYSFEELSDDNVNYINKCALSLMFCSIAKNHEWGACTSENFVFFRQNFARTDNHINYTAGSFVRVENIMNDISRKKFVAPEYIQIPFSYSYDNKLIEALIKAIDQRDSNYDRIFQSLGSVDSVV